MRREVFPIRVARRAVLGALASLAAAGPVQARHHAGTTIGVILPSGEPAQGLARRGAEIAAALLGRRGAPVTLRFAETGAEVTARATMRLADEGASILVSAADDGAAEAALAVAERRELPLIVTTATAPGLGDRGSRLLLRTGPTTSQLVGRGLGLLRDLHQEASLRLPERLALVHADDAAGRQVRASLTAILPAAGLPLAHHADIAVSAAGVRDAAGRAALAASLRAASPDLVLLAAPPTVAGTVLTTIAAAPLRLTGIASFGVAGLAAAEIVALPDKAGECHVTFSPWPDPVSATTAEVRRLYEAGGPALPFSLAQGALGLVVDAVLLAGETTARHPGARGAALAGALRGSILVQKMMRGPPMRFDARGQNIALPSVALQNQGDRPVVVLPSDAAEAGLVWPNPLLSRS